MAGSQASSLTTSEPTELLSSDAGVRELAREAAMCEFGLSGEVEPKNSAAA